MSSFANQLFYITHIDNLNSILKLGIYSHQKIENEKIPFTRIYDAGIVSNRRNRRTPNDKSLWEYANVYFQARNPMLYRVLCEKDPNEIAVIGVDRSVLNTPGGLVSIGNAASFDSDILPVKESVKAMSSVKRYLNSEYWNDVDGSKRKIMAECLIPEMIAPSFIRSIYVDSDHVAQRVRKTTQGYGIEIIPEPRMFFTISIVRQLGNNTSIVKGDMFFSRLHTLTISVNTVGIMGKGLASRAKYQFPDVYVHYQDVCRSKALKMGKPVLYKRESSFDFQLADEPSTLKNGNGQTWFLLFATKRHWKNDADFEGIETGMRWVVQNYKKEGIKSLALPALGCGLGKLPWSRVGPMICKYLVQLDVKTQLYLPAEKEVSEDEIDPAFLLNS